MNESNTLGIRLLLPDWGTLDLATLIIGLIAALVYFVLKWDMLKTIFISVVCGIVYYAIFKGLGLCEVYFFAHISTESDVNFKV